jgi:predicted glycoside hydrolase/deacetylase ChbG (UPF0249 family)
VSVTRLVINADDLGLAESVNRGIFETIEKGVVTSTSLMVNMAACDDAIQRLRDWLERGDPRTLSVGLHFNIAAGSPLASCGTLVGARRKFLPLPALAWRALNRRIDEHDVHRELEAQLDRAKRLLTPLGMRVTHIDSHRHVHCLPVIFDVVMRAAKRHGIGHVRHPYEAHALLWRPHALLASRVLRAIVANRRPLDDVWFAGVGAMRSRSFASDIATLLAALPPGTTELMVHPGYDSPELAAIDSYRAPRERELRALTAPVLRDRILELGVQLTPFEAAKPAPVT